MQKRLLLIGWDGAEPQLVSTLLTQGLLPNLAKLIQNGYFAPLQSTIRPESSIAWTTFATGVNAGIHGVFGFMRHRLGSYETELNNSTFVHIPYFWETLSNAGKQVVIVNMPMVYPPRPVNGYLICGLMTPDNSSEFTYPPELKNRLLAENYSVDAKAIQIGEDRRGYLLQMKALVQQRTKVAIQLLSERKWDLGLVVFTELDRVQHFFWADMSPQHPLHPKQAMQDAIVEHYQELDVSLGNLMACAGAETDIIVISDHGFGPCSRQFHVNAWLAQQEFLMLERAPAWGITKAIAVMTKLKTNPLTRKLKQLVWGAKPLIVPFKQGTSHRLINWRHTRAWFADTGGIRINLQGREPQGIVTPGDEYENLVSTIIDRLKRAKDPQTNNYVAKEVYRREYLYSGPQVEFAPDIIVEPYRGNSKIDANYWISGWNYANSSITFSNSSPYSGEHTNYGIIAENILPTIPTTNIQEVTARIMSIMGVPLETTGNSSANQKGTYTDEDQEIIKQRLSDLGYI